MAYPAETVRTYIGSQRCATCHQAEFAKWQGSHHEKAMQDATPESVLGNFDDAVFEHFGVTTKMFRRDGKYWMNTEGADGKLADFAIRYTFGVAPLQQYLVEFPDGRLQVLPICWDTVRKRWFHVYDEEPIRPGDELHWTGHLQTWNHMCAECHSTDVHRNYDAKKNTYATSYSEVAVGCEACHGPGSLHAELADSKKLFWDRRFGKGLSVTLKDASNLTQIETCAMPCSELADPRRLRTGQAIRRPQVAAFDRRRKLPRRRPNQGRSL
ncbi:MAG: multiheme c-type cytochrome [Pirellulales bacterium]